MAPQSLQQASGTRASSTQRATTSKQPAASGRHQAAGGKPLVARQHVGGGSNQRAASGRQQVAGCPRQAARGRAQRGEQRAASSKRQAVEAGRLQAPIIEQNAARGSFREAAYAVDRTVRTARKRPGSAVRSAPYVDNELPSTWAMACLSFAGILEFMRLVQPTKMLVDGVVATGAYDVLRGAKEEGCAASTAPPTHPPEPPFLIEAEDAWTVSDYILGGSLAGAVFKGSSVQTSAGERLARRAVAASAAVARSSAQNRRAAVSGVGSGLVAGATLGLLAGMLHVAISNLEQALEDSMELDSAGVDQSKSDDEDEASKEQICAEDSTS